MCRVNLTTSGYKPTNRALTSASARSFAERNMPGCVSWSWPRSPRSSRNGNVLNCNQARSPRMMPRQKACPCFKPQPVSTVMLSAEELKRIGVLYMRIGLVFLVVGGVEEVLLRLQLAIPNNDVLPPDTVNQLFTMHGTTMIFVVVMLVMFRLANYVLPLQSGARDMAFPR